MGNVLTIYYDRLLAFPGDNSLSLVSITAHQMTVLNALIRRSRFHITGAVLRRSATVKVVYFALLNRAVRLL